MKKPGNPNSPNAKCRTIGCQTSVPSYGCYPGLPQAHCTRCGARTRDAAWDCKEFIEPHYPEGDGLYLFFEKIDQLLAFLKKVCRKRR